MITVVDYGVNNLRSVRRAFEVAGYSAVLTADPDEVRGAERVVVPGVGHFGQAARTLHLTGLGPAIRDVARAGRPVMGICLGLQLFFESSEEAPEAPGLGLLPGRIQRFATSMPVPHVGWARVEPTEPGRRHPIAGPLFAEGPQFYYHVHSYHPTAVPDDAVLATGSYGEVFPTLVGWQNLFGAQFHPEKSQRAGIELLGAFGRWRP